MRCAEVKREKTTSSCLKNYMKIIESFGVFFFIDYSQNLKFHS